LWEVGLGLSWGRFSSLDHLNFPVGNGFHQALLGHILPKQLVCGNIARRCEQASSDRAVFSPT
jgi:hypothetical protein